VDAILHAAQSEILKHSWGFFVLGPPSIAEGGTGVVVPGCEHCQKYMTNRDQFMQHLANDVLPDILTTALERTAIAES